MKRVALLINIFCCLLISTPTIAQPIKEQYDIRYVSNNFGNSGFSVSESIGNPTESGMLANTLGEAINEVMQSQLEMWKATGDRAYLVKFINLCLKIQSIRNDQFNSEEHPGWINVGEPVGGDPSTYLDSRIIHPMAEFTYLILANIELRNTALPYSQIPSQSLIHIPNAVNSSSEWTGISSVNLANYGNFAIWLAVRLSETIDYFITNYWEEGKAFKRITGEGAAEDINKQASYASTLLYLGNLMPGVLPEPKVTDYRNKFIIMANLYKSTINISDHCTDFPECAPVNYYNPIFIDGGYGYYWYSEGWRILFRDCSGLCNAIFNTIQPNVFTYTSYFEDIGHAVYDLKFPLAAYSVWSGLFSETHMIKWRKTFTQNVYAGPNSFHNNVAGQEEYQLQVDVTGDDINHFLSAVMRWMPLYKFDDAAGVTPNVYDIIMDYYQNNKNNQSPLANAGEYEGLSNVVSAQWDKECPNLTLYNRKVVYNQDFFAKGELTIAPNQTTDANFTSTSYAEPTITTQEFTVEPGVEANFVSGKRIVIKKGHIKQGAKSRGYIDPSLYTCATGRYANPNDGRTTRENEIGENERYSTDNSQLATGKEQTTKTKQLTNNLMTIDLSRHPHGIYFVKLTGEDGYMEVRKIVYQ